MEYIVFDLEWNQPFHNDISFLNYTGFPLAGEIIQIGAVKLDGRLHIIDQFKVFVKPKYLKTMNTHVEALTRISFSDLAKGVSFKTAYTMFINWCGAHSVLLSWGHDDFTMLRDNMQLHRLSTPQLPVWYDAQLIYSYHVLGTYQQVGLQKAMDSLDIESGQLEAHDALHDAIFTAKICQKINLLEGIKRYSSSNIGSRNPLLGIDVKAFFLYENFSVTDKVMADNKIRTVYCPNCQAKMTCFRPEKVGHGKYMSIAHCDTHGTFSVQWKIGKYISRRGKRRVYVTKSIGASNKDVEQFYTQRGMINKEKEERARERYHKRMANR